MKQTKNTLGAAVIIFFLLLCVAVPGVLASPHDGPIRDTSYAWGENIGWINFKAANGKMRVTDTKITGFAWSQNYGWFNFAPAVDGVTNTCEGKLGGHAWSSSLGWIPFSGVTINAASKFTGMAGTAGSAAGRINFDCANCNVTTDWQPCAARPSGPTATPTATPNPTPTPTLAPIGEEESLSPSQLFDIRLLIDSASISRVVDLVARVTFESFGRVPTPVAMTFFILDSDSSEVWKSVDTTTVQTSAVFVKRFFDAPELAPGNYTLYLTTLYNTDVKDEFEAPFTIAPKSAGWNWVPWFVGGLLLLFSILVFVWWLIMRRRREQKQKGLNNTT